MEPSTARIRTASGKKDVRSILNDLQPLPVPEPVEHEDQRDTRPQHDPVPGRRREPFLAAGRSCRRLGDDVRASRVSRKRRRRRLAADDRRCAFLRRPRTAVPAAPPASCVGCSGGSWAASDPRSRPSPGTRLDQPGGVDQRLGRGRELPGHGSSGGDEERRDQRDEQLAQHGCPWPRRQLLPPYRRAP